MSNTITVSTEEGNITYELAGFGERLGARLLDVLIIAIPNLFIPILPGWLYWALQQSSKTQATVGQKALKIRLMDLEGRPVSFGQASGRYFGNILNVLTLGIGFLMFFFNENQQCLHDLVSGCVVVKEEPIETEEEFL